MPTATQSRVIRVLGTGAPIALAVLAGLALFAVDGTDPVSGTRTLWVGSVGTTAKLGDTISVWVPLALAAASLVVTFRAGLWNIGVEGQIVLGAVGATWVSRVVEAPSAIVVSLAVVGGALAGGLWGLFAGVLKVYGGVNEIFAGLGLDFAATGLTIYLIIGPWQRDGVASTSGTEPLPSRAWFPEIGSLGVSPLSVALAALAVAGVAIAFRSTVVGIRLRAVGMSPAAAARFGVPVDRYLLGAFAVGGALAGLAGVTQSNAFHHKLVPSISGGYGFLAILLVLLASNRVDIAVAAGLFFAATGVGSLQLELREGVDSSFAGVMQALLVLLVLVGRGVYERRTASGTGPSP